MKNTQQSLLKQIDMELTLKQHSSGIFFQETHSPSYGQGRRMFGNRLINNSMKMKQHKPTGIIFSQVLRREKFLDNSF